MRLQLNAIHTAQRLEVWANLNTADDADQLLKLLKLYREMIWGDEELPSAEDVRGILKSEDAVGQ